MERQAWRHALPRSSRTQGTSDSRPPPRSAYYASRDSWSYKGAAMSAEFAARSDLMCIRAPVPSSRPLLQLLRRGEDHVRIGECLGDREVRDGAAVDFLHDAGRKHYAVALEVLV